MMAAPSNIFKLAKLALAGLICVHNFPSILAFSSARYSVVSQHHSLLRTSGSIERVAGVDLVSLRRKNINGHLRRLGASSGENEDDIINDPNPGGLNQWADEETDKRSFQDLGFFEQVREWFSSEEGKEDIRTYTFSLGFALLLRFLIIEPRYIPSLSMYPTFEVGDQLAVEKVTKRIRPFKRNEVVVFNPPVAFREIVGDSSRKAKEALIKRIVAIEGDKVEVRNGKLFVNDVEQVEPFTAEAAEYEFGPVIVPAGDVLVLGDNRNHSLDGHIWGFLPAENVIGRAVFVYWPPWRLGTSGMY